MTLGYLTTKSNEREYRCTAMQYSAAWEAHPLLQLPSAEFF